MADWLAHLEPLLQWVRELSSTVSPFGWFQTFFNATLQWVRELSSTVRKEKHGRKRPRLTKLQWVRELSSTVSRIISLRPPEESRASMGP